MIRNLLFLGLLVLTGCTTGEEVYLHGVPNYAVVSPGVYRGGQPNEQGWRYLRAVGVTNVIKLNEDSEATDDKAVGLDMAVWSNPISLPQQLGLAKFPVNVKLLDQLKRGGLFIHCEHGQDRTGLYVAMYRVKVQGWSKAEAEIEMLAMGFHKSLRGLWEYWEHWNP